MAVRCLPAYCWPRGPGFPFALSVGLFGFFFPSAFFFLTAFLLAVIFAWPSASPPTAGLRGPIAQWLGVVGAVAAWAGVAVGFYATHPLTERPRTADVTRTVASEADIASAIFSQAPRFTEDITGPPIEPVNVILLGTPIELGRAFERAQWRQADPLTSSRPSDSRRSTSSAALSDRTRTPGVLARPAQSNELERPTPRNSAQGTPSHASLADRVCGERPARLDWHRPP